MNKAPFREQGGLGDLSSSRRRGLKQPPMNLRQTPKRNRGWESKSRKIIEQNLSSRTTLTERGTKSRRTFQGFSCGSEKGETNKQGKR